MDGFASWTGYTRFLITLTAVLDPFFAVAVFLTLPAHRSAEKSRRLAAAIALTVLGVLLAFALVGEALLNVMGASLASLRVGGGLVLLLMALAMLNAQPGGMRQTGQEANELESGSLRGIVPLAIPMLAGPGAISTVVIAVQQGGFAHRALIALLTALVCLVLWAMLRFALPIGRRLGTTGLNVFERLLGLLLTAIAIETMAVGLKQLFPGLAGS